jgi:hypothetical protein
VYFALHRYDIYWDKDYYSSYLSGELKELLTIMFQRNLVIRLTFDEIMDHKWTKDFYTPNKDEF